MSETMLIVGLGNPGSKYEATRHNVGHMVLDRLAEWAGASFKRHKKANASVIEGRMGAPGTGRRVILAKLGCYMNTSGGPVSTLAQYYGVDHGNVIVVHDEIDTQFGAIKAKLGGGEGGHNGLRDITRALGTKDYLRVRVGVGRPPQGRDTADYVLAPFSMAERKVLGDLVTSAGQCVEMLVEKGLVEAQQEFHSREAIRP
ncbi:aminoacyl-tRNA hydrolase [Dermabacter vaginalis]|uniref:aminoacyl-tRNA hydrolase n=1 Tax=Dermabacter vaginalis TaxID=1630135 RepID=UPI00080328A7|nr:aminoacyl-tRNA hydrolase [Dermabacter vaginalis]